MFPKREILEVPSLKREFNEVTSSTFYRPDVVDSSLNFAKNYGGYVRNDIALINDQTSLSVAQALAEKLVPRNVADGSSVDTPNTELLFSLKSRYNQTPSEVISHIEKVMQKQIDFAIDKESESADVKELQEKKERLSALKDSLNAAERDEFLKRKREKEIDELLDNA